MKEKYLNPIDFDILIKDLDEAELYKEISKYLKKPYLKPLQED